VKDIKLLEGVLRRTTKLVEGIENWNYNDKLEYLRLSRLDTGRVSSDLIETFKIMNNVDDICKDRMDLCGKQCKDLDRPCL